MFQGNVNIFKEDFSIALYLVSVNSLPLISHYRCSHVWTGQAEMSKIVMSDVSKETETLTQTILVHLTPGCREETLDIASRVLLKGFFEKLAIRCCQFLSNLIRGKTPDIVS